MTYGLTGRQAEVLAIICQFTELSAYPSIPELTAALEIQEDAVREMVERLEMRNVVRTKVTETGTTVVVPLVPARSYAIDYRGQNCETIGGYGR